MTITTQQRIMGSLVLILAIILPLVIVLLVFSFQQVINILASMLFLLCFFGIVYAYLFYLKSNEKSIPIDISNLK